MCLAYFCLYSGCTFLRCVCVCVCVCVCHRSHCERKRISRFRVDERAAGGLIGPRGRRESVEGVFLFFNSTINTLVTHTVAASALMCLPQPGSGWFMPALYIEEWIIHCRSVCVCVCVCVCVVTCPHHAFFLFLSLLIQYESSVRRAGSLIVLRCLRPCDRSTQHHTV